MCLLLAGLAGTFFVGFLAVVAKSFATAVPLREPRLLGPLVYEAACTVVHDADLRSETGGCTSRWGREREVEVDCSGLTERSNGGLSRQNRPDFRQQRLKAASRTARAKIVAAKLLKKLFITVHDSHAALDACLRGEAPSAFATLLERSGRGHRRYISWETSLVGLGFKIAELRACTCLKWGEQRMSLVKTEMIDAHHHLWRYTPSEYDWIDDSMEVLRRDFLPHDLKAAMRSAGVDGAIAVQARQTLEETRWLLDLAEPSEEIRGVVGWAPIAGAEFPGVMEEFDGRAKLKGLRHIIQGEKDENYILRENFNAGIRALVGSGLVYEILIYERHLQQTIEFVDRHPEQVFVLDHIAKPLIAAGIVEPWTTRMRELAKRENVWCKISGMVTEADW